jgi:branched-chain amino acid transport system substrate-binding protein
MAIRRKTKLAAIGLLAAAAMTAHAQKVYNAAGFSDFSGPYAGVFAEWMQARETALAWWNKEVGPKIGVRINLKQYDNRYDTAQTASLWPTVKAELNPIVIFGVGAPDVSALQQRLPDDKIPMVMATAGYGYSWQPDAWVFNPRPPLAFEFGAFLDHQYDLSKRPVRFALVSSEASPGYVDFSKGLAAYAKGNKKVELVEILNTEMQPADLTLQVRRIANAKVDFIAIPGNTAQVVAVKRALQALNQRIPVVLSSYNGFLLSAKAMGGVEAFEGDFETCACTLAAEGDLPARRFYEMLKRDYGLKSSWNSYTLVGLGQALFATRAVERAVAKAGPDRLTGQNLREAIVSTSFSSEELMGVLPKVTITRDTPFPLAGTTATVTTVKGGKVINVATQVPIPTIAKW